MQTTFQKKIDAFSSDIEKMSNRDMTNLKKIQLLVNKYVPGVKVNQQNPQFMLSGLELGTTLLPLIFDDGKVAYCDKELQINTSLMRDVLQRKANLVHEFTHLCQSETDDKSKIRPLNEYIEDVNS